MRITGARSYILVAFDHRTVKIQGELTTTPAFYAMKNSIKAWEKPYDDILITDEEKRQIIKKVTEHENPDFKIYFE